MDKKKILKIVIPLVIVIAIAGIWLLKNVEKDEDLNFNESIVTPVQVIPTQIFINADGTPYLPSKDINIRFAMYNYKNTEELAFTAHEGVLTEKQFLAILKDMGVME